MNVESKLARLEDLGRQIQCQGKSLLLMKWLIKLIV